MLLLARQQSSGPWKRHVGGLCLAALQAHPYGQLGLHDVVMDVRSIVIQYAVVGLECLYACLADPVEADGARC